nr:unnamed protein product [Callosobruchus analis]
MGVTDKRGVTVTEWVATNDLVIINQGDKPTFQRKDYGSILDLTIATVNIARDIINWEVCERECMSDHNYTTFSINSSKVLSQPDISHKG